MSTARVILVLHQGLLHPAHAFGHVGKSNTTRSSMPSMISRLRRPRYPYRSDTPACPPWPETARQRRPVVTTPPLPDIIATTPCITPSLRPGIGLRCLCKSSAPTPPGAPGGTASPFPPSRSLSPAGMGCGLLCPLRRRTVKGGGLLHPAFYSASVLAWGTVRVSLFSLDGIR